MIRDARRAYFANISYLDDKFGKILEVLETTQQEAHILFVSDHGDMLGERGLWFKMSFYEECTWLPLMISAPELPVGLLTHLVSKLDVCPTPCDLAYISLDALQP